MRKGYVIAFLRVDGKEHNFINVKRSKWINLKAFVPENVIEKAQQVEPGECIALESKRRCTLDVVQGCNNVSSYNYEGKHKIYVSGTRIIIK